jgi:hypothetical protein
MRIREEDCNMVLLAGVTLLSVTVATTAAWLEPASAGKSTPDYASAPPPSSVEKPSIRLADQAPVRVIGAPFVPNTNPRER